MGRGRGPEPSAADGRGLKRAGNRVPPPQSFTHSRCRPSKKKKKKKEKERARARARENNPEGNREDSSGRGLDCGIPHACPAAQTPP